MTRPPCYKNGQDCSERHVGCKSKCDRWKEFERIHAEEKAEMRKKQLMTQDTNSFLAEGSIRRKKKWGM